LNGTVFWKWRSVVWYKFTDVSEECNFQIFFLPVDIGSHTWRKEISMSLPWEPKLSEIILQTWHAKQYETYFEHFFYWAPCVSPVPVQSSKQSQLSVHWRVEIKVKYNRIIFIFRKKMEFSQIKSRICRAYCYDSVASPTANKHTHTHTHIYIYIYTHEYW